MRDVEERFWGKVKRENPSGCWHWVGNKDHKGYGQFWAYRRMHTAHRFAWELVKGVIPDGLQLDHICHSRSCVNPTHLRLATRSENTHNQELRANNTSGFKGVSHSRGKWRANICIGGIQYFLGRFDNPAAAHAAYCKAAKRLHGEFANSGQGLIVDNPIG